ncbi:hypothetical protein ABT095_01075 [Kitasatospora sp. NPDC002227]|uniref:hypothetical protein n=1 Tax=Kitasatospora sp. NPDC002227 TaxID=3154773 RepID=UPI00331CD696
MPWAAQAGLGPRCANPFRNIVTRAVEPWDGADLAVVVDAVHGHPGEPGLIHRVTVDIDRLLADPLADAVPRVVAEVRRAVEEFRA